MKIYKLETSSDSLWEDVLGLPETSLKQYMKQKMRSANGDLRSNEEDVENNFCDQETQFRRT